MSDREKVDFALTAGSSSGLIDNMNNQLSIFVKKLRVRELGLDKSYQSAPGAGVSDDSMDQWGRLAEPTRHSTGSRTYGNHQRERESSVR